VNMEIMIDDNVDASGIINHWMEMEYIRRQLQTMINYTSMAAYVLEETEQDNSLSCDCKNITNLYDELYRVEEFQNKTLEKESSMLEQIVNQLIDYDSTFLDYREKKIVDMNDFIKQLRKKFFQIYNFDHEKQTEKFYYFIHEYVCGTI